MDDSTAGTAPDAIDLRGYLGRLASTAPTPGGGAAAALAAALGAASVAKVIAVSVGKPRFAAHDAALREHFARLETLRERFLLLAEEDERAFAGYMAAYRLPKGSEAEREARAAAVQEGMRQAAAVPLRLITAAREVLELAAVITRIGNPTAIGDCGAGAALALAAMHVSVLNVTANIAGMVDAAEVAGYRAQLAELTGDVDARERALREMIRRRLAGEE